MSSLIVSNDLEIMMLEFAVQKLYVPKSSVFDSIIMKKTTVMFRILDYDWTMLNPHRADWVPYRGSNLEEEDFHGGKSVVFAIPTERLENQLNGTDIQIYVWKELSKYFELEPCQNVGTASINVDDLFNGIIKELKERKELEEHLSGFHKRQPISRSLKGTYGIMDENQQESGATITVYVRLSHFGKSIITEIEVIPGKRGDFYAQEETNESYPYQCREITTSKLEGGCWGSATLLPPLKPDRLTCHCDIWDPTFAPIDESYDSDHEPQKKEFEDYDPPTLNDYDADDGRDDGEHHDGSLTDRTSMKGIGGKKGVGGKKGIGGEEEIGGEEGIGGEKGIGGKKGSSKNGAKKKGRISESGRVRDSSEMAEDFDDDDSELDGSGEISGKSPRGINAKMKRMAKNRSPQMEGGSKKFKKSVAGSSKKEGSASRQAELETIGKSPDGAIDSTESSDHGDHPRIKDKTAELGGEEGSEEKLEDKRGEALTVKSRQTPSEERRNRRSRMRRRQRGIVTVGFRDKERKICHEALKTPSTSSATLPPVSSCTQSSICPNLHSQSYCCYPTIMECKPARFLPFGCSTDTSAANRLCSSFGRPNYINMLHML